MNIWVMILLFAALGITSEVVFTAVKKFINTKSLQLQGESYLYMIPIYGCIPLLFQIFHSHIASLSLIIRLSIIVLCIYCIEYISGYLLEKMIGKCPRKYTDGLHINGYIRLNYIGFWLIFAYMIERLFLYLQNV